MKAQILTPKTEAYLKAINNLVKRGNLTVEQANECSKRVKEKENE